MTATFDPAPRTLAEVVDPAWLTAMLRQGWPGATVRRADTVELLVTQATKIRLALEVEGDEGAPTRICIKGILTDTGAPPAASIVETLFYRDLAARLPVRTPPCLHAGMGAEGKHGVVVMRDLIAGGARFLTALEPADVGTVRDALDQIARLHHSEAAGNAGDAAFVPRFLDTIASRSIVPIDRLQTMMDGERGAPLPAEVRDAARLHRAIVAFAAEVRGLPSCLVHGDAHAGNLYRDADGIGLIDWQVLQRGEWAMDVAYTIAAALTPEDRRAHERALLDHYRDRRRALGGSDLPREAAWERLRAAMVYGYYMWAITRTVAPPIINEFNRRLGLAVADHESFRLLGV